MYKKAVLDGDWTTTGGRVIAHHAADDASGRTDRIKTTQAEKFTL